MGTARARKIRRAVYGIHKERARADHREYMIIGGMIYADDLRRRYQKAKKKGVKMPTNLRGNDVILNLST